MDGIDLEVALIEMADQPVERGDMLSWPMEVLATMTLDQLSALVAGPRACDRVAYSVKRLEEATGVPVSTIRREIATGKLVPRRVRGRTVVMTEDAKAWLKAATVLASAPAG